MSNEKRKKLHLLYGCTTAVLLLIVAVGLIVSCVSIYNSGDRPFNRQVITQAFAALAIPGWLSVAAMVGSFVLHLILPLENVKPKAVRDELHMLNRYSQKLGELSQEEQIKVQKEARFRKGCKVLTGILTVLLAVYPVIYYCDMSHFGISDLNSDMLYAFLVVLVPAFTVMGLICTVSCLCSASIAREIALYQAAGVKPGKAEPAKAEKNPTVIRALITFSAIVLIVLGIFNEGYVDVIGKAIKICTECIGLG